MSSPASTISLTVYYEAIFDVMHRADDWEMVFWSPHHDGLAWCAVVQCSDWFYWACADGEEVRPDDVPLLRSCLDDLLAVEKKAGKDGHQNDRVARCYVGLLFACRKRQMRPMRRPLRRDSRFV